MARSASSLSKDVDHGQLFCERTQSQTSKKQELLTSSHSPLQPLEIPLSAASILSPPKSDYAIFLQSQSPKIRDGKEIIETRKQRLLEVKTRNLSGLQESSPAPCTSPSKDATTTFTKVANVAGTESCNIKLGDTRVFAGSNLYITSYAKASAPKLIGGLDDFLFESHENVPVKRIVPLKKSPVMLMKLVAEKMMMKHVVFSVLHRCSDGSVCMLREFVECTAGGSRALRLAFTSVDLDGNGQLDYYELCEALKAFNIVVNQEECRELFISLGANEKGYICYNDFRRAVEEASSAW